jgi:tetratricopeptide (TPR) repeat protein
MAGIYFSAGDYKKALTAYLRAERLADEINSSFELKDIYKGLAVTYSGLNDFKSAYKYPGSITSYKGYSL